MLETDGRLSVILIPAERPLTAAQAKVATQDSGYASIIINDGKVMRNNLKLAGRNKSWLEREIKKRGLNAPEEVYLLSVDDLGRVFFAAKEVK